MVFAEVDVVDAFASYFYAQDFSSDTFIFADVVRGFLDGEAVGAGEEGGGQGEKASECDETKDAVVEHYRASPVRTAEGGCPHMS
ncbi:MAG: hypothetical protein WBQ08_00780 [Candidatus Sulfotelmatobacter sp.]